MNDQASEEYGERADDQDDGYEIDDGQPITPRYMISSKHAKSKEDAIDILDGLANQKKGKWKDSDKKEFLLAS